MPTPIVSRRSISRRKNKTAVMAAEPHLPVLYQDIIHALQPRSGCLYVDCTLGAGGHSQGILEASQPDGRLLGLDLDPQAIEIAKRRLAPFGERVRIKQISYVELTRMLELAGWDGVDGVVFDLGVSSMQFDTPDRGFSFQHEAPLDMRFDPDSPVSAAELVNQMSEAELAEIIFRYGEDRNARRIARAIVRARPLHTTKQLATVVADAGGARSHLHPATRTFQALRIAVNEELKSLEAALPQAVSALKSGGRLAIISFHSLEDRIVKDYINLESTDCLCPPRQPICTCGHTALIKKITRKPIVPSESEISKNSRARSAKLRIAEKI
jgi:16S rRNA (cytosine1402-N4)-methyltransferase